MILIYYIFVQFPNSGYFDSFHFLGITNSATVNTSFTSSPAERLGEELAE